MRVLNMLLETKIISKKTLPLISSLVVLNCGPQEKKEKLFRQVNKNNLISITRVIIDLRMSHRKEMGDGLKRNIKSSLRVSKFLEKTGYKFKII